MINKTTIIIIIAALLVAGATFAVFSAMGDNSATVAGNAGEESTVATAPTQTSPPPAGSQKSDNSGNTEQTDAGDAGNTLGPPPTDVSSLRVFNSSVTAQQSLSDETIDILFYIQDSGYFTIQEKVSDSWKTVKENVYYGGSGGLPGAQLAAGENVKTLRLVKIENNAYTAATREYTVSRSDVVAAGGIKTY